LHAWQLLLVKVQLFFVGFMGQKIISQKHGPTPVQHGLPSFGKITPF
jgi:hypothetical protein